MSEVSLAPSAPLYYLHAYHTWQLTIVLFYIQSPHVNPDKLVDIGKGPVKGMKRYHSRLYICCGIEVVVMEVAKDMVVTRRWKALDKYVTRDKIIYVAYDSLLPENHAKY